jgi:hypothetical protein
MTQYAVEFIDFRIHGTHYQFRNILPLCVVEAYHFKVSTARLKYLGKFLQLAGLSRTKQ